MFELAIESCHFSTSLSVFEMAQISTTPTVASSRLPMAKRSFLKVSFSIRLFPQRCSDRSFKSILITSFVKDFFFLILRYVQFGLSKQGLTAGGLHEAIISSKEGKCNLAIITENLGIMFNSVVTTV